MKGQLSAEMLIVLAIVLVLALIAFTQMTKSTKDVGAAVDAKTDALINGMELVAEDTRCYKDSDCARFNSTWSCDLQSGYCR
jgi:uncharacterized protein (UPF0333 family)